MIAENGFIAIKWKESNVRSYIVKCTYRLFPDVYREQLVALRSEIVWESLDVRLHHANDVTRAKYAPMAYEPGHRRMNKPLVPFFVSANSFLPDTVIRN